MPAVEKGVHGPDQGSGESLEGQEGRHDEVSTMCYRSCLSLPDPPGYIGVIVETGLEIGPAGGMGV